MLDVCSLLYSIKRGRIMKFIKKKKKESIKINDIFLLSACFFAFFSFFGLYDYKIYSLQWFFMFFIYELLFYFGLKSGQCKFSLKQKENIKFQITKTGKIICTILIILSILSFAYFVISYKSIVGWFVFGQHTSEAYYYNMPTLEKYTLIIMEAGGTSVFMILSADKSEKHTKLRLFSTITLFLTGLRYLLMGSRYVIAVEFLILFSVKWPQIKEKVSYSLRSKRQKRLIIISGVMLWIAFLYLFVSRATYSALMRKSFNIGDMSLKPFWKNIYEKTDGKIDFLCTLSDYLGESPYVFSYYCKNYMPDKIYWGQLIGRTISQILNEIFGIGKGYGAIQAGIANGQGQYSGFAFSMIADFGVTLSPLIAFLYGFIFSRIEYYRFQIRYCAVIYPAIQVICFFAPIFYFFVGRVDYAILFAIVFTPFCIGKIKIRTRNKN